MIKEGIENDEIIRENTQFLFNIDKIEKARQMIKEAANSEKERDLKVTYVFGKTGTGKTSDILKEYGHKNVYRVTNYDNPFDTYRGQDVIVFEEFRSSLKMNEMLNYLDRYPLLLPCRYIDRQACYTKVYIVSNIPVDEQYLNVQKESKYTWQAFMRRIGYVKEYNGGGVVEKPMSEYYWYQDDLEGLPV